MPDSCEKGVEHKDRFLVLVDKWTNCALEDVSKERVSEIFQDCVCVSIDQPRSLPSSNDKQADKLAKKIKTAIVDSTPKHVRVELTEALEENDFDQKFQRLHDMREKYKDRTQEAWRPPYVAKDHMRTDRVKIKEGQLNKLKLLISLKKLTIAGLKEKVQASSAASVKINESVNEIEENFTSIRKKSTALKESMEDVNHQLRLVMDNATNENFFNSTEYTLGTARYLRIIG
uniref:Kinesin-related protein 9 n=2 Tax=Lygus hesperus TaxID=30085 RepID=A0A0A9WC21_LYGHE